MLRFLNIVMLLLSLSGGWFVLRDRPLVFGAFLLFWLWAAWQARRAVVPAPPTVLAPSSVSAAPTAVPRIPAGPNPIPAPASAVHPISTPGARPAVSADSPQPPTGPPPPSAGVSGPAGSLPPPHETFWFGRASLAWLSDWAAFIATGVTPPAERPLISHLLAQLPGLTGITEAQIYLLDPTRPGFLALAATLPAGVHPPKRAGFLATGTPLAELIRTGSQLVPDPARFDLSLPVPFAIATPVVHGDSVLGLLLVEGTPPGVVWNDTHCLLLFSIGQVFGQILAADHSLRAAHAVVAERSAELARLSERLHRLESTTDFLDREVDRQYFQNQDLERDRQHLVQSFQKFVSPLVIDQILADPAALQPGGQKQCVTIFFADIRGFTRMSSSLDPERIVHQLNQYFSAMTTVIHQFGGTLDKFIGDEIMALFGAPVAFTDAPVRAVFCALEMQARLNRLRQEWTKSGFPPFAVGFGLNSGDVTVGFIGSTDVLSYTAIGDPVNVASRLCSQAKPGQIIISANVAALVRPLVRLEDLPPLTLKGKETPVPASLVLLPAEIPDFVPPEALLRMAFAEATSHLLNPGERKP
jgi:class 3 adenylate cyclase